MFTIENDNILLYWCDILLNAKFYYQTSCAVYLRELLLDILWQWFLLTYHVVIFRRMGVWIDDRYILTTSNYDAIVPGNHQVPSSLLLLQFHPQIWLRSFQDSDNRRIFHISSLIQNRQTELSAVLVLIWTDSYKNTVHLHLHVVGVKFIGEDKCLLLCRRSLYIAFDSLFATFVDSG